MQYKLIQRLIVEIIISSFFMERNSNNTVSTIDVSFCELKSDVMYVRDCNGS